MDVRAGWVAVGRGIAEDGVEEVGGPSAPNVNERRGTATGGDVTEVA